MQKDMITDSYKEIDPVNYGEHGMWFRQSKHRPDVRCFPAHWHDRIELLQIVSGSLKVWMGDVYVTAHPGQTVMIMPHMTHGGITGPEGLTVNMIAFDPAYFKNDTAAAAKYIEPILRHDVCFCRVADHPLVVKAIEELEDMMQREEGVHPLCIQGRVYELLGLFHQYCTVESGQRFRLDEKFDKVLAYIEEHYTENITTKSISRMFGYEEAYFCRRFKGITGITSRKYIRILRLELAQKLLRSSEEDIKAIALLCGFPECSYFSNCFRKHFGVTPQEFRKG